MENLSSSAAQPLNLPSAEGRRRTEMCMILFLKVIAAINVLALAGVCAYLAIEGLPVISWSFLTEPPKNMMTEGGIFPCIIGTAILSLGSLIIAFPLGVASAIYLHNTPGTRASPISSALASTTWPVCLPLFSASSAFPSSSPSSAWA